MIKHSLLLAAASGLALTAAVSHAQASSPPAAGEWPALVKPAPDAPSILLIMTDDVGFGASSTFGGPVSTPTFDALAMEGLRYTQMTTTGICSPTRAALLTGRNHNAVNVGNVTDAASGFEGFTSDIPKSAATGARLLRDAGYATAMFGKGHITPSWETGPTGPFDRWPTGLGFGHFYGFLGGDTNQWAPALYSDNSPVEAPTDQPGYILDRDLADKAIAWINRADGANNGKPQFIYYAPGTAHAPHHAPPEWIAKFRGRFDRGWDAIRKETLAKQKALGIVPSSTKLAARPDAIPAWSSLTDQQKRVYAHEMEVYAAALAYADDQIGRVIEAMRRQANGNLIVVYVQGDNGGSAEAGIDGTANEHALFHGLNDSLDQIDARRSELGGPTTMNHYSSGWAFAMSTPFPWFKQLSSHFGATRNGVVISWPDHIRDRGGVRPQFHHIIDIMPTLLDVAHVSLPAQVGGVPQQPLDGVSMRYSFDNKSAPSRRNTQYYSIWDNMGIYHDGWFAASMPEIMPWTFGRDAAKPAHIDGRQWQLYNLGKDFSESTDVAARYPQKLAEMKALFEAEAGRYKALPVHRYEGMAGRPNYIAGQTHFVFNGPADRIPEDVAPPLATRSFALSADVRLAQGQGNGTLLALGGRFGGLSWYLKQGRPTFRYNMMGGAQTTVSADTALQPGDHRLGVQLTRRPAAEQAGATLTLLVDGKPAAHGEIPATVNLRFTLDESFDVGSDRGTPVAPDDYAAPNLFDGALRQLSIDVK
ncbi:sulfatase-like hydrolase/transferase [Sphingobium sp. TB-6]|uniref:sulfatase-like hydrolase/transferase n=1 Tax=Sphingobium sp. TB-6 TaxID=2728850 RepID=UPI00146DCCE2|nr:sulfatase-like hydrolase/transferase [Sphingobium sp. TB-6]NML91740.1 sulfatase-like hydrolase/transferase [Sphingobium sp. TB-6]